MSEHWLCGIRGLSGGHREVTPVSAVFDNRDLYDAEGNPTALHKQIAQEVYRTSPPLGD